MVAARERWFIDGYELTQGNTLDVEKRDGLLTTPALIGDNATVPNRTGLVWRPKKHGQGVFTLNIWWGEDTQDQAQDMWDILLRAFILPHRLATYTRVTASGESRICKGEVAVAMAPAPIGQGGYRAGIEVHIPDGYWQSLTSYTAQTAQGAASGTTLTLTDFTPSTAPNEKLLLTFAGQYANPKITETTTDGRGEWIKYGGTIPDGQSMSINCDTWALTGTGGFVPDPALLTYSGDRFFTLGTARPGVDIQVQLTADTVGTHGRFTLAGQRSYLT
jgi:hypothetical protein